LPESLTGIGEGAFSDCNNLSIVIAKNTSNVTSWNETIFNNCSEKLTLYEGEGYVLKEIAHANSYIIKKYIDDRLLSDLLSTLAACSTVEEIVTEISNYIMVSFG